MEQLSVAEGKLANVMSRLLGVDVFAKKLEMDEERFVPEGLGYKTDLFEEEEKVNRALFHTQHVIAHMMFYRRRMTWRAGQRRRRSPPGAISRDSQTSSWTQRAEAREAEGSAKREIYHTNSWNLSRLVILSVKRNHSLLYLSCVSSLVNVKFVGESQKYIFIISLSTMMLCLSVRL